MNSYKQLTVLETAKALDDIIKMQINSNGIFSLDFSNSAGVTVSSSSASGCATVDGSSFFPYDSLGLAWSGAFAVVLNDCQGSSGTSYSGSITVGVSGSFGVVTRYDYTGNIIAEGEIEGKVKIDIHYVVDLSCLLTWDCWSGTVNGYSIDTLRALIGK